MTWNRKHFLDIQSLSAEEITFALDTAKQFKAVGERAIKKVPALRGRMVLNLFYEARVTGGDPRPNDDVSEILWLEPGRIDPERFSFACCREAIRLVVRKS